MEHAAFEKLLREVRVQKEACKQDEPEQIARFIADNPRPKLAHITLTGRVRPPNPTHEVVSSAIRGLRITPAIALKTMELVRRTQRKKKTFGRGELKLV